MKISKKAVIAIIAVVLTAGAIILVNYLGQVKNYKEKVENLTFSSFEISAVADGKYTGESDVGFISVEVEVLVQNRELISIDLIKHDNGRGTAAEKIIDEMIAQQTTDVDVVSGATNSSKVIRKAVENALLG